MENIKTAVGSRIRSMRKDAKLTQEQLAERAGLSNETISRVERGIQGANLNNYAAICLALDMDLKDLFNFGEENLDVALSKKKKRDIFKLLDGVKTKDIDRALEILKLVLEGSEKK